MPTRWVNLGKHYVNTTQLVWFFWQDGELVLYLSSGRVFNLKDPYKEIYIALATEVSA